MNSSTFTIRALSTLFSAAFLRRWFQYLPTQGPCSTSPTKAESTIRLAPRQTANRNASLTQRNHFFEYLSLHRRNHFFEYLDRFNHPRRYTRPHLRRK